MLSWATTTHLGQRRRQLKEHGAEGIGAKTLQHPIEEKLDGVVSSNEAGDVSDVLRCLERKTKTALCVRCPLSQRFFARHT